MLKKVLVLLAQILASWFLVVATGWVGLSLTKAEELVIGLTFFAVFLLIDVLIMLDVMVATQRSEAEFWQLQGDADQHLCRISSAFRRLIRDRYGDRDLFVSHFLRLISDLANTIVNAAENRRLQVTNFFFHDAASVLGAFRDDEEKVYRFIWRICPHAALFADDPTWHQYFVLITEMLKSKKIKGIRAILIPRGSENDILGQDNVGRLLGLFACSRGMEFRVLNEEELRVALRDHRITDECEDFGIYGESLLFLGEEYRSETRGTFIRDRSKIRSYKGLFEALWKIGRKRDQARASQVTLQDVLDCDTHCATRPRTIGDQI